MLTRKLQGDTMLFYEGEKLILSVDEVESEGCICMVLKGNLVSDSAHHIQDELNAFTSVGVKVVMDFKEVTFVSPSVMYVLLESQTLIDFFRKGEIVLRNISDEVYQMLYAHGITDLLMIED